MLICRCARVLALASLPCMRVKRCQTAAGTVHKRWRASVLVVHRPFPTSAHRSFHSSTDLDPDDELPLAYM